MFVRKYVIPALSLAGLAVAGATVALSTRSFEHAPPASPPAVAPYERTVAGAGLVEAATENIAIAAHRAGVVAAVHVRAGDEVAAGAPLFTVDDRAARADLASAVAALEVAEANVGRLAALPRREDVPAAEARVAEAEAEAANARADARTVEALVAPGAVSREEYRRRRAAADAAEARLRAARAELALLEAGAWVNDLAVARADAREAGARVERARVELEKHTVRAPVGGQVLRLNVRAGEYAPAGPSAEPLVLLGSTATLHVRVDVDEHDAWRVSPGAPALASLRGNSALRVPLRFVRVEPYVVPKKSLTGAGDERVDTRVLQVLYAFERGDLPVYIGQQMDVHIEDTGEAR